MLTMKRKNIYRNLLLLVIWIFGLSVYAQESRMVSGKVTDNTSEPLPGVNIVIKGTSTGTVTDFDGNYQLQVPNPTQATLVYRFIGFDEQEVAVGNRSVFNIVLESSSIGLDEIVAIGYGTARRRDLMGSVSSVTSEQLNIAPVASAVEAMTGRMAGVQITTTEGNPDADIKIRVRGGGSITGDNSPLYIVDGFPVASISDVSPSDIESIDILKDASSTAIYGARGANGVVIVTTKGGKAGRFSVSYNAYYGVKEIANKLDVLDPYDYAIWQYELMKLRNVQESTYTDYFGNFNDMDMYRGVVGNDWQDQVFGRTGSSSSHSLSVTGGTDMIRFSMNYSNLYDKAIMRSSNFSRDNLSLKVNSNPIDKLSLDFSVRYSNTSVDGSGANAMNDKGSTSDSRLKHTVMYTPIPLKGIGNILVDEDADSDLINPIRAMDDSYRERNRANWNVNGAVGYELFKNLTLKSEVGLDDYNQVDNRFYGTSTYYSRTNVGDYVNMPAAVESGVYRKSFRNTNTIYYDFKDLLSDEHSLNVLAGQEYMNETSSNLNAESWGLPNFFDADLAFKFMSSGTPSVFEHFYNPDDKLFSFFGRANYDFLGKYSFTSTFRADGSSKFSEENRWGYFPSAAVAWRLSEEEFLQADWLDNLRMRFSYGSAGNNKIPANQMSKTFAVSPNVEHGWTSHGVTWSAGNRLDNPDLKWETTITRNLGLDFSLFRSSISGTVEVYQNNTKDLLLEYNVAGSGYASQYRNTGETENKGLEVALNYVALDKRDYGLSFNFNIGFNKNEIVTMGMMEDFGTSSGWASSEISQDFWISKGGSVGQFYGYVTDGRYEVSDFERYDDTLNRWILNPDVADNSGLLGYNVRPGALKLQDMPDEEGNYDGVVNLDDRKIIGDANPKHSGGLSISGRYKGFDLNANFNWVYGNDLYNANKVEFTSSRKYRYRNMITEMEGGSRWNNLLADGNISNDPAQLETMNANTNMWSPYFSSAIFHDWAVEDGSFLRLSTLSLGYTIPSSLTQRFKIERLRLYATGYNLWLWTNYSGYDPEVDTRRSTPLTPGVDYSAYPKSKQVVFGINLNF